MQDEIKSDLLKIFNDVEINAFNEVDIINEFQNAINNNNSNILHLLKHKKKEKLNEVEISHENKIDEVKTKAESILQLLQNINKDVDTKIPITLNKSFEKYENFRSKYLATVNANDACAQIHLSQMDNVDVLFHINLSENSTKNTRHQDKRDIDRDNISINEHLLSGADLGYNGILESLIERCESLIHEYIAYVPNDILHDTLLRFCECVLNAANRTNSGGAVYEAIMKLYGGHESILLTPDSDVLDPLHISIELDIKRYSGLVVSISGTTHYKLFDALDFDLIWCLISGKFQQQLVLPLPLQSFKTRYSSLNGFNKINQQDYTFREDSYVEQKVSVELKRLL